jgi:hypothetical protein
MSRISHILSVKLTALTADFQSGMQKAERTLKGFEKSAEKFAKIGMAAVTTAVAAATAAMVKMGRDGLRSADDLAKTARSLQMTNAEMRSLEIFSKQAGVGVDTLADGIKKMSVELSRISSGQSSGGAVRELGLDIQALAKMRPAEQFAAISKAIGNMADKNRAAALSAELFKDRTGAMLNAIRDGNDGFARAIELTEKYGLALSEVETGRIERVNDQFTLLGLITKSAKEQFASGLAPALETINELLLESTGQTRALAKAGHFMADVLITGAHFATKAFFALQTVLIGGELAIVTFSRGVAWALNLSTEAFDEVIADLTRGLDAARAKVQDDSLLDWYTNVLGRIGEVGKTTAKTIEDSVAPMKATLQEMSALVSSVGNTIESTLTDAFMTGKFKAKEMIQAIIKDMIQLMIKISIIRPMFGAMGGAMGGGSLLGQAFSAYATGTGGFGGGRASGGAVAARTSYVVGERGPELFTPNASGVITPNNALGSGATINIDARGADAAAVARIQNALGQLNASVESRSIAAVGRAFGRSPGFLRG